MKKQIVYGSIRGTSVGEQRTTGVTAKQAQGTKQGKTKNTLGTTKTTATTTTGIRQKTHCSPQEESKYYKIRAHGKHILVPLQQTLPPPPPPATKINNAQHNSNSSSSTHNSSTHNSGTSPRPCEQVLTSSAEKK